MSFVISFATVIFTVSVFNMRIYCYLLIQSGLGLGLVAFGLGLIALGRGLGLGLDLVASASYTSGLINIPALCSREAAAPCAPVEHLYLLSESCCSTCSSRAALCALGKQLLNTCAAVEQLYMLLTE